MIMVTITPMKIPAIKINSALTPHFSQRSNMVHLDELSTPVNCSQSVQSPQGSDRLVVGQPHFQGIAIGPPDGESHEPLDPLRVQCPTNDFRQGLGSLLHPGLSFLW